MEAEYKNEAMLLITEKVRPHRNDITKLRDLSVLVAFVTTIFGFAVTSMNGALDFTFENDNKAAGYSKEVLGGDSTIKTKNYDSLYVNDSNYKKKVDNFYNGTVKKKEKQRNGLVKFIGIMILASGGACAAMAQFRLKKYDTALDEFKSNIDSRVKLKSLLVDIINKR